MFRDSEMYYNDVEKLYDMLPSIIEEMGHECKVLHINDPVRRIYNEDNSIYLAWHNHGTSENVWFLHTAYLRDYFYFDKTGYSGWSQLASQYIPEATPVAPVTEGRFDQTKLEPLPTNPYVLVLLQRPNDTVAQLAYIDQDTLAQKVIEVFEDTEYDVYVKPHPLEAHTGSLKELISGSSAVYTVNSGGGFEALLQGKRVFTAGRCDYHWVTTVLGSLQDVEQSKELVGQPVDQEEISTFVNYCLHEHFMNINDVDSIKRKLEQAIEHATNST